MRVSTFQVYRHATDSLMRSLADMFRLNEQVASGKRINKPSDDVTGISRALAYKVSIAAGEQYRKNVDDASSVIGYAENALASASGALVRAKELAVLGANGTQDAASRDALAEEIGQLRDQLLSLANSRFGDRYVFSGFRTDTPSFDASFAYQGDAGAVNVAVGKDVLIPQNVPGQAAFGYAPASEEVVVIDGGRRVHYIPGGGTTVNVEIRASDDTTVLDSFSFDNAMRMTDLLSQALSNNDSGRITALIKPLEDAATQMNVVRADLGARLNRLEDQGERIEDGEYAAQTSLSAVEDADIVSTASEIAKADTALQALRAATGKILSKSLLDFLS
jgi:flagellar hook-associated protein 3 FlgL